MASGERHPAIEGYDPEGLYERYRACREAVSGELGGDWRSDRRAILREMERRDPEWLRTGTPPDFDDGLVTSSYRKEMMDRGKWFTYMRLSSCGIPAQIQQEDKGDVSNIDCKIRGSLWEVKGFSGNAGALWKQMGETITKWERQWEAGRITTSRPRVIVDLTQSSLTIERARQKVIDAFDNFAPKGIEEMFVLMPDGSQIRFKR